MIGDLDLFTAIGRWWRTRRARRRHAQHAARIDMARHNAAIQRRTQEALIADEHRRIEAEHAARHRMPHPRMAEGERWPE